MSPDASDQEQGYFLLLRPYRSHREIVLFPLSRVVKANCGHFAWLSPQGERHAEMCYTICLDCGDDVVTDTETEKAFVPGTLEALRRDFGDAVVAETEVLMKKLNIRGEGDPFHRPPHG